MGFSNTKPVKNKYGFNPVPLTVKANCKFGEFRKRTDFPLGDTISAQIIKVTTLQNTGLYPFEGKQENVNYESWSHIFFLQKLNGAEQLSSLLLHSYSHGEFEKYKDFLGLLGLDFTDVETNMTMTKREGSDFYQVNFSCCRDKDGDIVEYYKDKKKKERNKHAIVQKLEDRKFEGFKSVYDRNEQYHETEGNMLFEPEVVKEYIKRNILNGAKKSEFYKMQYIVSVAAAKMNYFSIPVGQKLLKGMEENKPKLLTA